MPTQGSNRKPPRINSISHRPWRAPLAGLDPSKGYFRMNCPKQSDLLMVALGTFALMDWATAETYRLSPPQPKRFVSAGGAVLFTDEDLTSSRA